MPKSAISTEDVKNAVRIAACVAIDNEKYFCDLDGELGDADFGRSLATGFRGALNALPVSESVDIGEILIKVGTVFASTVGGTSGPIWGTAFMRAGMAAKNKESLSLADLAAMGNAAVKGIMARGGASPGDKTLLDAIIPAVAKIEEFAKQNSDDVDAALQAASDAATSSVESTRSWVAKRGRQSYASERTIGTLDPGIVAVAKMLEAVTEEMKD